MPINFDISDPAKIRFLGTGNGGYAGGFKYSDLEYGIKLGFAVANTDLGTNDFAEDNTDASIPRPAARPVHSRATA